MVVRALTLRHYTRGPLLSLLRYPNKAPAASGGGEGDGRYGQDSMIVALRLGILLDHNGDQRNTRSISSLLATMGCRDAKGNF